MCMVFNDIRFHFIWVFLFWRDDEEQRFQNSLFNLFWVLTRSEEHSCLIISNRKWRSIFWNISPSTWWKIMTSNINSSVITNLISVINDHYLCMKHILIKLCLFRYDSIKILSRKIIIFPILFLHSNTPDPLNPKIWINNWLIIMEHYLEFIRS